MQENVEEKRHFFKGWQVHGRFAFAVKIKCNISQVELEKQQKNTTLFVIVKHCYVYKIKQYSILNS